MKIFHVFSYPLIWDIINIDNVWNVLSHIFATNAASSLFERRDIYNIVLLGNSTDTPFITGDQPIVNTFAVGLNNNKIVSDLELYYPVSPILAVLLTNDEKYINSNTHELTRKEIIVYNKYIIDYCHEQIYSNSKKLLEEYLYHMTKKNKPC